MVFHLLSTQSLLQAVEVVVVEPIEKVLMEAQAVVVLTELVELLDLEEQVHLTKDSTEVMVTELQTDTEQVVEVELHKLDRTLTHLQEVVMEVQVHNG
jgi:hypothetical protein